MTELLLTDDARRRVMTVNLRLAVAYAVGTLLLLGGLAAVTGRLWVAVAGLLLAGAMVASTTALARRSVQRSRITFGDGTYTVHGLGRPRRFTAGDVASAAMVTHMSLGAGPTHHLVVAGTGGPLVHLVGQMWTREQLTALAHDLAARAVPVASFPSPLTPAQLRAHDRRLVAAWRARPALTALLAGLAVLLLLVVVLVVAVTVLVATTEG